MKLAWENGKDCPTSIVRSLSEEGLGFGSQQLGREYRRSVVNTSWIIIAVGMTCFKLTLVSPLARKACCGQVLRSLWGRSVEVVSLLLWFLRGSRGGACCFVCT